MMFRARFAHLWGGPEDGERLWIPPGDLPRRLGVHRTARGELVPIRGASLLEQHPEHVHVYGLARPVLVHAMGLGGLVAGWEEDGPLYLWLQLVATWAARQEP